MSKVHGDGELLPLLFLLLILLACLLTPYRAAKAALAWSRLPQCVISQCPRPGHKRTKGKGVAASEFGRPIGGEEMREMSLEKTCFFNPTSVSQSRFLTRDFIK